MHYNYSAIVLSKRDIADADRFYTFYTKEDGKITALAKGVRRGAAKLAPHLENFSLTDLTVARSRGVGKVTTSIVEESFPHVRADVDAVRSVFVSLRSVDRLMEHGQRDHKIFAIIADYLKAADRCAAEKRDAIVSRFLGVAFLLQLTSLMGYHLSVLSCMRCGRALRKEGSALNTEGMIVCSVCARETMVVCELSENAIKFMRVILTNPLRTLPKLHIAEHDCARLELFMRHFIAWILR